MANASEITRSVAVAVTLIGAVLLSAVQGGESAHPSPELFRRRARAAFSRGEYRQAVVHLEAALSLRPDDAEALYLLGVALYHCGLYEDAVQALLAVPQREPDYADYIYHYYLGAAFYRLRLYRQAAREFRQVTALHPSSRLALQAKRHLLRLEALERDGAAVDWYLAAAERGLAAGKPEWAALFLGEAEYLSPQLEAVRALRARVELARGRPERARLLLEQARNAESTCWRTVLVELRLAEGHPAEALKALEEAPELDEEHARRLLLETVRRALGAGDEETARRAGELLRRRWPHSACAQSARLLLEGNGGPGEK